MGTHERANAIGQKLQTVIRRKLRPFGADRHGFRLLPPVPESRVRALEAAHGITIPADYRVFITRVASGGAGPAYGLIPFEEAPRYERDDLPQDIVGKAFPFTTAYNPETDTPQPLTQSRSEQVAGTIVVCHEGCGHLHLLVVHGEAYGQMWCDSTVSDGGYAPLGVGFFDWYERWLDDCLAGGDGVWWLRERGAGGPTRS
jgi:hypothetical protein